MPNDTVHIKVRVNTGFVGGTINEDHEYSREDWFNMSVQDQEAYLEQCCETAIANHISAYAEAFDSEDDAENDD